jgi:hypothetical protein
LPRKTSRSLRDNKQRGLRRPSALSPDDDALTGTHSAPQPKAEMADGDGVREDNFPVRADCKL